MTQFVDKQSISSHFDIYGIFNHRERSQKNDKVNLWQSKDGISESWTCFRRGLQSRYSFVLDSVSRPNIPNLVRMTFYQSPPLDTLLRMHSSACVLLDPFLKPQQAHPSLLAEEISNSRPPHILTAFPESTELFYSSDTLNPFVRNRENLRGYPHKSQIAIQS